MSADPSNPTPRGPDASRDLLISLMRGASLALTVPSVLEIVERDPMASAGGFAGDFLRGLIDVPATFWRQHPQLFDRYRNALRAGAIARRALPQAARLEFWTPLDGDAGVGPTGVRRPRLTPVPRNDS